MRMLTNNIAIILVNTQFPGNIGSVARAMKNMGITDLRLVNTVDHMEKEARIMAVGAVDVLENARIFSTVEESLKDFTVVAGTSRRARKLDQQVIPPWELADIIAASNKNNKIAILFGSEDRGLTSDDLNLCQYIVRIPVEKQFGSLNLSHAVMVILYEIRKRFISPMPGQIPRLATSKSLEEMFQHVQKTLLQAGFLDPKNPRRIMTALKTMAVRASLQDRDVKIIRGIIRQLHWYMNNK